MLSLNVLFMFKPARENCIPSPRERLQFCCVVAASTDASLVCDVVFFKQALMKVTSPVALFTGVERAQYRRTLSHT